MELEDSLSRNITSVTLNPDPIISKPPPFYLRLAYFISLWSFKIVFQLGLSVTRQFSRRPKNLLRPEIKTYEVRPDLKNRIFRPPYSKVDQLPLYLDVHGGGWAVADPETDDEFCSFLAQNFNIIVVSVNYHKSPTYKFPHAVEDVTAIAQAVLHDQSLNIDKNKVVLGGFSAGGNLAFAAAQTNGLIGKVRALVGFYPALDLTESLEEKLSHRSQNAPTDILASSANFLGWAYVPPGTDLRNPLLSPALGDPKKFPSHVYLVGAEYDMLCYESQQMANSLASYWAMDYERESLPKLLLGDGWQQGSIRWECARGKNHAFTHVKNHGKKEKARLKFCQEMYCRVGCWLKEEVWPSSSIS